MAAPNRHPPSSTDDEPSALLRFECRKVTQRVVLAKREMRDLVAPVEADERQLREIDRAEDPISSGQLHRETVSSFRGYDE